MNVQTNNVSENNFEQCIKCTICTVYCPVVPVNPLYPGSWPWRVGDVYYTTTVTAKNGEN